MRARALLLALLVAAPVAGAWPATIVAQVEPDLSVQSSLLLSGAIRIAAPGASFGAIGAPDATFGDDLTVEYCPDTPAGITAPGCAAPPAQATSLGNLTTAATLRIADGGFVAIPAPDARLDLNASAAAVALGGTNVTVNLMHVGLGAYMGGAVVLDVQTTTLSIRPLGRNASIEVDGAEGARTYNGTGFTLYVTGMERAHVPTRGAYVALHEDARIEITREQIGIVERSLALDDLHAVMRAVLPGDRIDRRADLATAFGPFQVVPALLNGAIAQRRNLTLNDVLYDDFLLVRVTDMTLARAAGNWTGIGNATYVVESGTIAERPGDAHTLPLPLAGLLAVGAIAGRAFTTRTTPAKRARILQRAARAAAATILVTVAIGTVTDVFGVSLIREYADLSPRARAQLGLLALGAAALAYALAGIAVSSLTRSALARWRTRWPLATTLTPILTGCAAALLVLWLNAPALVSAVARIVRL